MNKIKEIYLRIEIINWCIFIASLGALHLIGLMFIPITIAQIFGIDNIFTYENTGFIIISGIMFIITISYLILHIIVNKCNKIKEL